MFVLYGRFSWSVLACTNCQWTTPPRKGCTESPQGVTHCTVLPTARAQIVSWSRAGTRTLVRAAPAMHAAAVLCRKNSLRTGHCRWRFTTNLKVGTFMTNFELVVSPVVFLFYISATLWGNFLFCKFRRLVAVMEHPLSPQQERFYFMQKSAPESRYM